MCFDYIMLCQLVQSVLISEQLAGVVAFLTCQRTAA
jgi:hypothetical protein